MTVDIKQRGHVNGFGPSSHEDGLQVELASRMLKRFVDRIVHGVKSGVAHFDSKWSATLCNEVITTYGGLLAQASPGGDVPVVAMHAIGAHGTAAPVHGHAPAAHLQRMPCHGGCMRAPCITCARSPCPAH